MARNVGAMEWMVDRDHYVMNITDKQLEALAHGRETAIERCPAVLRRHFRDVEEHRRKYQRLVRQAEREDKDPRAYKGRVTEAAGEKAAAIFMAKSYYPRGFKMESGFEPGTGFDQLWVKRDDKGGIEEIIIVEAKGPGVELSTDAEIGPQMTKGWVLATARDWKNSPAVSVRTRELCGQIEDALLDGPPPNVTGLALQAVDGTGAEATVISCPPPLRGKLN